MAPSSYSGVISYTTGWFNLFGNLASDAFFAVSLAEFLETSMRTNFSTIGKVIVGILALVVWSALNMLHIETQTFIHTFGAIWQITCTFIVIISLFITCASPNLHATNTQIFLTTYNGTGFDSFPYVTMIGTLCALYSFSGYEAAGQMAEETTDPSVAVPKGIIYTVIATSITGFIYIYGLLYASAHRIPELTSNGEFSVNDVFLGCMGADGAWYLNFFILINLFFSGISSETVTIRQTYTLARDSALPFSKSLSKINVSSKSPINATAAVFLAASLLVSLQIFSSTAFIAVTSISTIGFQLSYLIPIALRAIRSGSLVFTGPFSLGVYGNVISVIACVFLGVTSLLFLLPVSYPITLDNFNWTGVVAVLSATCAYLWWTISAKFKFKGGLT